MYRDDIEAWVEQSQGKIRADIIHDKLVAKGFTGSARTTRRAVREAKEAYRLSSLPRPRRPWVTEPGLWVQYDFGDGPLVDGEKTTLFVAWLAWSRYRVVFPLRNRKMTKVLSALDRLFRAIGGVPAYVLTGVILVLLTLDKRDWPVVSVPWKDVSCECEEKTVYS